MTTRLCPSVVYGVWRTFMICLYVVFFAEPSASAEPVVIRVSLQTPLASQTSLTFVHFKDRVEAASSGSLRVEIYESSKLFKDDEIAGAISDGKVEMGYVVLPRYAAKIPAVDVFQLPFLFNNDAVAAAARAPGSEIRQIIDRAILEQAHSRALWWIPQGPNVLLSKTSLADPEAANGKIIRTFGPMMESFVRHCGGVPKDIGGSKQAAAYQDHLVDVGMTGVSIMIERQLYKSLNVITRTNHATVEDVAAINEAFWQRLTPEHKAIVLDAAKAADAEAAQRLADSLSSSYTYLTNNKLATVVKLSSDQVQLWRFCSSDVLTDFLEQAGGLGRELISAYGRLRLQPCCSKAEE